MKLSMLFILKLIAVFLVGDFCHPVSGGDTRIAVSANFTKTARQLIALFDQKNEDDDLVLISGSTGKLAAQIVQGAPFDAFLSADAKRVDHIILAGKGQASSSFIYAFGRLVLWHRPSVWPCDPLKALAAGEPVAIANEKLAPYGAASIEALQRLGRGPEISVYYRGDSVAQVYAMVKSGNARLGMIAAPDAMSLVPFCRFLIPSRWHSPIAQTAILLSKNRLAKAFLAFLKTGQAKSILHQNGYDLPDTKGVNPSSLIRDSLTSG